MRNFEERKSEIFKRSREMEIEKFKAQRKIITVCVALTLCVSIVATILIPRLDILGTASSQSSSGDKTSSQNSNRVTSGGSASDGNDYANGKVINLMAEVRPNKITPLDNVNSQNVKMTDFALRLFKASSKEGKNALVSPLSVITALGMTANGAEKNTLAQMEKVFGMTRDELNLYLYTYIDNLPIGEHYMVSLANSIWFTDDKNFTVNQSFLQANGDFYGADIYKAPMNDATLGDVNNWVNQKTDQMIPKILDKMPEGTVMCLLNALAFDAEWQYPFSKNGTKEGTFTKEDGTKQTAMFMSHEENADFIEDENAIGLVKYYKDKKYAFVALLPNEGITISEYVNSLDGKTLNQLLSRRRGTKFYITMPKFETEYEVEMSKTLSSLGMKDAFSESSANFTGLGKSTNGNIFITKVVHKTFISVSELGTKAGAVTGVFMGTESEPVPIYLNRPFVYMLIDCENNVPFFIGTMMDVNG